MSITVRQLLEIPHLRTRLLAGAAGVDRPLTWAHACEEEDPTPWLNGGELVMTTGRAIPAGAAEQVAYLRRLDLADTGGITVGEQLHTPPISQAMLDCADELGLPLLSTAYEVPFIAVARAVVEGNLREEHARFVRTQRIYDVVRQSAIEDATAATMLDRLAALAGAAAWFVELPDASGPFVSGPGPPEGLRERLLDAVARREGPLPAVMRLDAADGAPVLAITVAASRPGVLLAVGREGKPDTPLLQHVATVAAVEFEKVLGARERDRLTGAELFAGLVDHRIEGEDAVRRLDDRGLAAEPRVVMAYPSEAIPARDDLHHRLAAHRIPNLLLRRAEVGLALLPAGEAVIAAVRAALPGPAPIGLSAPLGRAGRMADAVREAHLSLRLARAQGLASAVYGEGGGGALFGPRSLSEAQDAVARVLGTLCDYDAAHRMELVGSLRAFLEHNRSWQRAAAALGVHKQTLVYRMRRVEELTGRRLDRTGDVADLWYALQAERVVDASTAVPVQASRSRSAASVLQNASSP